MGISSESALNFREVSMDAIEFVKQLRRMDEKGAMKNRTCGNERLQLKRPPQSWCYVEEMKNV